MKNDRPTFVTPPEEFFINYKVVICTLSLSGSLILKSFENMFRFNFFFAYFLKNFIVI